MAAPPVPLHVAVLGGGSWGTALAALASPQASTLLWARNPALADQVNTLHQNPDYLPGIALPPSLQATASLQKAVDHVRFSPDGNGLIILGVPVAGLAQTCQALLVALQTPAPDRTDAAASTASINGSLAVVWTCKGFQPDTGQLPHEIAQSALGHMPGIGLGVVSGPSFADEVARGLPVALTVASHHAHVCDHVTTALHGVNARIYSSTDIVGVEVGGALKNVIAIACGISDGLDLGANARAALITRGLAEIQRLGMALGGQAETFFGLTGMGDLVLSATGQSRNRQVGLAIGQGQTLDTILASGITAEGVRCAQAALTLGHKHGVSMPITHAVCQVLFHGLAPSQAVSSLLARDARPEAPSTNQE